MMLYLTNAFSLSMLTKDTTVRFTKIDPYFAIDCMRSYIGRDKFVPAIGHADTAAIVKDMLMSAPILDDDDRVAHERLAPFDLYSRLSVKLAPSDEMIVAQYIGPRLPEGTTKLPEGARIEFYSVEPGMELAGSAYDNNDGDLMG